MNNRIQRGNVAELIVASEASKRQYVVSLPISHNSHYDLLLDRLGIGKIIKCQVKRAYFNDNHGYKILCIESRRISGKRRYSYPCNSYDYLVACNVDNNDIWFIPKEVADGYKAQVYLGLKMNKYKNKWV
jgi:hypothetical protein